MTQKEKSGQEPAFPFSFSENVPTELNPGISKRLYLAGMAMQGLLANPSIIEFSHGFSSQEWVAKHALAQADELLKQENL